jgi:hypothetical protein
MFKWQYRIVRRREGLEYVYGIHEYMGKKYGITEEPVAPVSNTPEGLLEEYTSMIKEAYHLPTLNYEDF